MVKTQAAAGLTAGWQWAAALVLAAAGGARAAEPTAEDVEFFEKDVRPLLVERCQECHAQKKKKGGLNMASRAAILRGGDTGPAMVPGKAEESLLIKAVRYTDSLRMPPKGKLADKEIAVLERWVARGAPWPASGEAVVADTRPGFRITDEQRQFWAFRPVKAPAVPTVKDPAAKTAIDRFLAAKLEEKGLAFAKPADKRTLLRRATFDLTGLPPTPAEIDAFLADDSPDAFAKVVDRLLASPHYGERWGRHWLDVMRYTDSLDTRGSGSPGDITETYKYRDWVVDAFNRDLPYDKFIISQIAGDLLPAAEPGALNTAGIIATGGMAIGEWGAGDADKDKMMTDIVDDQIDVVGRTFLGLTLACARCHDHKFDPISTTDYYGLAGIFFSSHIIANPGKKTDGTPVMRISLAGKADLERLECHKAAVAALEAKLKAATDEQVRGFAKSLQADTARYILAAWDYRNRPADQAKVPAADFAAKRGLHAFALRKWADSLDLPASAAPADDRLFAVKVRDIGGKAGLHGWRGEADCPSLIANTTDAEVQVSTLKLPARSVSIHPGPNSGAVVAWKSPIAGTVRISGKLADGDATCGDGIAWTLEHRSAAAVRELAGGDVANGGSQKFGDTGGQAAGGTLASVTVKQGDVIRLVVNPKANHFCDTTVVELTIAKSDGSATWGLTRDVLADPHQANPHADGLGNAAVWSFGESPAIAAPAKPKGYPLPAELKEALAAGKREGIERAAAEFAKSFDAAGARSPFLVSGKDEEKSLPSEAKAIIGKIAGELDAFKKQAPKMPEAHGLQEGGVPTSPHAGFHDARVHIRGSYTRLGDVVPRRFPLILAGEKQPAITEGSGRLQLAQWLASADNPLTARVMVNRIWQHHFGQGIVRTPGNFGKLGERPTHPELLDYLATRFVEGCWSIKAMHREMMLTAAYRQTSEPPTETLKTDPDNRLFGRMNRRRLEAEAVRDNLLSVAGKLDLTMGGPAIRDFTKPRRGLYVITIRSDRSGFSPLFDGADPTAVVPVRTVSTVAPQALYLLNNAFVLDQARAFAARIRALPGDDPARIRAAYVLLYGRPATDDEVAIGTAYLKREGKPEQLWEEYAQVLLCANEFVYVD